MKHNSVRRQISRHLRSWTLPALATLAAPALSHAATGLNILWYGNSFVNTIQLPYIFQQIAVAGGKPQPNIVNPSVDGMTLGWHIANNEAAITSSGLKWDYVVEQEYSTKPTNIVYQSDGNPSSYIADAKTLFNDVKTKSNSPNVKSILLETWSRSLSNNNELPLFYPSPTWTTNAARAAQMQLELRTYTSQAQANLGSVAQVSPVGDAFQKDGFSDSLYQSDFYHESQKGGLLAALVLYETIYGANSQTIPFAAANTDLSSLGNGNLSAYGINNATDWAAFTAIAESAVPEPTSLSTIAFGAAVLLRRRVRRR